MTWATPPHNAGRRAFIVKRRTVETHPRGTISKVRAVRKFSSWESVYYADTLSGAQTAIEDNKRRGGLYDYAVFHRGRKAWHA